MIQRSMKGDSGSAIFGIMPPLSHANSSSATGADTDKDTKAGVIGLLRSGGALRGPHINSGVTYAIPIEIVMEKIGECSKVLSWVSV